MHTVCDWILESRRNCHTRPFPFYLPSQWLHLYTIHTQCHYQAWLTGLLFQNGPVNSRLRQWDPWRVIHGRYGSEIHPCNGETSLRPSKHVWAYSWHSQNSQLVQTVLHRGFTLPPASHPPPPPAPPFSYLPTTIIFHQ